jgi:hypothetical protein
VDYFTLNNPFAHSSVLFRRSVVRELGGYPADYIYAQDFALWLNLSCHYPVANLSEELVQIRIHPDQTGSSTQMRIVRTWDDLRVYTQAQHHLAVSAQARKTGHETVTRAMLNHAEALLKEEHWLTGLHWAGLALLRAPCLSLHESRWMLRIVHAQVGINIRNLLRRLGHLALLRDEVSKIEEQ